MRIFAEYDHRIVEIDRRTSPLADISLLILLNSIQKHKIISRELRETIFRQYSDAQDNGGVRLEDDYHKTLKSVVSC